MHTITLLVGEIEDGGRLPVQIVPNDGLDDGLKLTALRVAEGYVIAALVQAAEERGRVAALAERTDDEGEGE